MNEVLETILKRRSIRHFTDKKIGEEDIHLILRAGMASPSAVNSRDWSFIVVDDRELLNKMADANGQSAQPLKEAALGILVCVDTERSYVKAPNFGITDAAICAENMILAAESLGISSVWLGVYPQEIKMQNQKALFNLPDTIIPNALIAFGYPNEVKEKKPDFEENRVHYNKW